jgi:glycosyltransferase involved in cell wall biosynthesis
MEEGVILRIAICHHTLSSLGGGERVGVSLISALNKEGIVPDVYTTQPIELSYLKQFYGKNVKYRSYSILPLKLRAFGIYQRLMASFTSFALSKYDVVVNTTGIYTPLLFKNLIKRYLLYVYNPLVPLNPQAIKENLKYFTSTFWKTYFQPYQSIIKMSIAKLNNTELLAVSNFTRYRIKKYWNKSAVTIYPPVDIKRFSVVFSNKDRDGFISIARFTPEKNHLWQLNIAKNLKNLTFRICGSANSPYYKRWFRKVKAKAESMDLKNVEFYPNISFKRLIKLIGQSKFFIHTMVNEDFGLTTCEAIAGGCIPIVHDSGGQREVVPIEELRFKTVGEACKIIAKMNKEARQELRKHLFSHIKRFSEENFKKNMLKVILNSNA